MLGFVPATSAILYASETRDIWGRCLIADGARNKWHKEKWGRLWAFLGTGTTVTLQAGSSQCPVSDLCLAEDVLTRTEETSSHGIDLNLC